MRWASRSLANANFEPELLKTRISPCHAATLSPRYRHAILFCNASRPLALQIRLGCRAPTKRIPLQPMPPLLLLHVFCSHPYSLRARLPPRPASANKNTNDAHHALGLLPLAIRPNRFSICAVTRVAGANGAPVCGCLPRWIRRSTARITAALDGADGQGRPRP